MRWQKQLRLAIAVFVVAFAILVVVSFRHGRRPGPPPVLDVKDEQAQMISEKGHYTQETKGKTSFDISFGNSKTYPDGRSTFGGGVKLVLPDKQGRRVT